MELGFVGLGRMGGNMVKRLLTGGHTVVAFDVDQDAVADVVSAGAHAATSLADVVQQLDAPRIVWVMLPHGYTTFETVHTLAGFLSAGDILVDGGNSNHRDSVLLGQTLAEDGIRFLDVGTSHGILGDTLGYGLMIGGETEAVDYVRPLFQTLAPTADSGWMHVGNSGAGHFAKSVHNGVQYGMLQALAEGFALLQGKPEYGLDVAKVAQVWQEGGVIRSLILQLMAEILEENPTLEGIAAWIDDNETGRWTVEDALEENVPVPAIMAGVNARYRSRMTEPFGDKLIAAYRNRIGGHAFKQDDRDDGA